MKQKPLTQKSVKHNRLWLKRYDIELSLIKPVKIIKPMESSGIKNYETDPLKVNGSLSLRNPMHNYLDAVIKI